MSDWEKDMRREKLISFVVAVVFYGFLYLATKDTVISNMQILWAIFGSMVFLTYKIIKLEELIVRVYVRLS